jgi:hypothetical protein
VNKYKLDKEDETAVLEIDNVKVRNEQIASLQNIRATRDDDDGKSRAARSPTPRSIMKTCWPPPSTPPAFAPRWVKSPTRWRPLLTAIWFPASASPA